MTEKIQCQKKVYPKERWGAFHGYQCTFKAVVKRDGKWYCKKHDPEYKKAKSDESLKRWQEKWDRQHKASEREQLMGVAFDGVTIEQIQERLSLQQCPCCGRPND